jgi:hypothetical protein
VAWHGLARRGAAGLGAAGKARHGAAGMAWRGGARRGKVEAGLTSSLFFFGHLLFKFQNFKFGVKSAKARRYAVPDLFLGIELPSSLVADVTFSHHAPLFAGIVPRMDICAYLKWPMFNLTAASRLR